jgi:hypothetical protein
MKQLCRLPLLALLAFTAGAAPQASAQPSAQPGVQPSGTAFPSKPVTLIFAK